MVTATRVIDVRYVMPLLVQTLISSHSESRTSYVTRREIFIMLLSRYPRRCHTSQLDGNLIFLLSRISMGPSTSSFVTLLTGLVLRGVVDDVHLVPLPHVTVDGAALVLHGEVANLAAVHIANNSLKREI